MFLIHILHLRSRMLRYPKTVHRQKIGVKKQQKKKQVKNGNTLIYLFLLVF